MMSLDDRPPFVRAIVWLRAAVVIGRKVDLSLPRELDQPGKQTGSLPHQEDAEISLMEGDGAR
jgi:hypothetical protein